MTTPATKDRPRLFRALGANDPPSEVEVDGCRWRRERIFKHDSWAATALYRDGERRIVCKFNRVEPISILPAFWIGWLLARRERRTFQRLAGVDGVPRLLGPVVADGKPLTHAVAHDFVPGHPLRWHDRVGEDFFPRLSQLLDELHQRGIAYVDLNKRENILVADDGRPCLVDFQISLYVPSIWPLTLVFGWLQQMDRYHYQKHYIQFRPDLHGCDGAIQFERSRPAWLKAYRKIAAPLREFRRRLLVACGVRKGSGKAYTEQFVEDGLRETNSPASELLRLQSTLISDRYVQSKGGDHTSYIVGMFQDLFQRTPRDEADWCLVRPLCDSDSRYHASLMLLKSTEFGIRTNRWSDEALREKHAEILARLEREQPTRTSVEPLSPTTRHDARPRPSA